MDAAYTKNTAFVVLDGFEVLLIMKALDELRYLRATSQMSGTTLINLAGLSQEWRSMAQDMGSPNPGRVTQVLDVSDVMSRITKELYGPKASWEIG